jgi:hypothetical protein
MTATAFTDPDYLEQVYAALFALLQSATFAGGIKIKSSTRAFMIPDQVAPADMPALILVEGPMPVEQKVIFGPAKWTFTAIAVLYVRAEGTMVPNQSPLSVATANRLIWGIQNAFETQPPYQKQTLGGLVVHAWIEGEVMPQVVNEQIVITVPIYMLAGPVD